MRNSDRETAELVAELRQLWKKRRPFLMQMEVGSPYDGCFYEPNLFLVTPPGSEMQKELQSNIPSRWSPRREKAFETVQRLRQNVWESHYNYDVAFEQMRGNHWRGWPKGGLGFYDTKGAEFVAGCFEDMEVHEQLLLDAEAEFDDAAREAPEPLEQPKCYVWPLYASGQGAAMDCIHGLRELIQVFEEESVYELANRPVWPEGLHGSRFATGTPSYGRITPVAVAPLGAINEVLPAAERYWMHALHVASEQWGVALKWKCEGCGSEIEYDEYEGRPEATGYSGDGGIGVHLHGVLCDQCLLEGACDHCRDQDGDPMNYYDLEVKEHGWNLCAWCTKKLLESCGLAGEVSLPETIELRWWKDPAQLDLPGVEVPPKLCFMIKDKPIEGLTFDAEALVAKADDMHLEHLHPEYGHGLALSGTTVENEAFKGVE